MKATLSILFLLLLPALSAVSQQQNKYLLIGNENPQAGLWNSSLYEYNGLLGKGTTTPAGRFEVWSSDVPIGTEKPQILITQNMGIYNPPYTTDIPFKYRVTYDNGTSFSTKFEISSNGSTSIGKGKGNPDAMLDLRVPTGSNLPLFKSRNINGLATFFISNERLIGIANETPAALLDIKNIDGSTNLLKISNSGGTELLKMEPSGEFSIGNPNTIPHQPAPH